MSSGERVVWGVSLPEDALTKEERAYLAQLPDAVPSQAWVWEELDRVWHECGLHRQRVSDDERLEEFYGHPVWVMNGLFSAADPVSAAHREAIASYVGRLNPSRVADFGGGFGELARRVSSAAPRAEVAIVEPFPRAVARARLAGVPQVRFVTELEVGGYDVVVAQDVLEHVERPVNLAIHLARSVRGGGTVIFANNFTPVIACHLPETFHLRYTFRFVMRALGLAYLGRVSGAGHAAVFRVPSALRILRARLVTRISQLAGPALEAAAAGRRSLLGKRQIVGKRR